METTDPLLTLRDAAAVLQVHPRTVRRMVDAGKLRAIIIRTGASTVRPILRFDRADLDALRHGAADAGRR